MTAQQQHILMHTLGFKGKKRVNRNLYVFTGSPQESQSINDLCESGLMELDHHVGNFDFIAIYKATPLGIETITNIVNGTAS